MDLRWARSATKHRISRERSRYVIEHCGRRFEQDPPAGARPAPILGWSTSATTQLASLEVMAIELEDGSVLVIHAMPLRDRYREQYEEAKAWRR